MIVRRAPSVAGHPASLGIVHVRGIGRVGIVIQATHHNRPRPRHHLLHIESPLRIALQIVHLTRIASPEPVAVKRQFRAALSRCNPNEVKAQFEGFVFDTLSQFVFREAVRRRHCKSSK